MTADQPHPAHRRSATDLRATAPAGEPASLEPAREPAPEPAAAGETAGPARGLSAHGVTLSYGGQPVVRDVSLDIPHGSLTAVIGPNGCGKSTLLKAFARLLKPDSGSVSLHGTDLHSYRSKEAARHLALLPQSPIAPEGITVRGLVGRGRFPHHTLFRQWSPEDEPAIAFALERTDLAGIADLQAGELSGGQRQRAWIAMVLAQQTELLLLDEPTTFLDIAHQYEVLELCAELNREGRTVVAVLHDLNQAARFADHLVVMRAGAVHAQGPPGEVLTSELVEEVFGLPCDIVPDPRAGTPMVVPLAKARTAPGPPDGGDGDRGEPGHGAVRESAGP